MILLDTNVISESMRKIPSKKVVDWIDAQVLETLYLSSITLAEIRFGIAVMPLGARKDLLQDRFENLVLPLFKGRVLAFDSDSSQHYANLMTMTRNQGCSMGLADALIAAIASANHMIVATRDEDPFLAAGLKVINPWKQN